MAVAYRMLGSHADAEDAVQETWLRFDRSRGTEEIADPRAWLTTVTARICLDMLRSARVRREAYIGPWLPEPLVERLPAGSGLTTSTGRIAPGSAEADPADRVTRLEEISFALLVVLEQLTPEQRVAFVLHDVFGTPFTEIADVLGTSEPAARQLASRARRAVADGTPRHRAGLDEQRRVLAAFVAAAEHGDIDGLLAVLAPDVVAIGDGGGVVPAGRAPILGAANVARLMAGLFRLASRSRPGQRPAAMEGVLVNGDLGLLVEVDYQNDRVRLVIGFAIADDRITGIFDQINPAKLGRVPPVDPTRNLAASEQPVDG